MIDSSTVAKRWSIDFLIDDYRDGLNVFRTNNRKLKRAMVCIHFQSGTTDSQGFLMALIIKCLSVLTESVAPLPPPAISPSPLPRDPQAKAANTLSGWWRYPAP